MGFTYAPTSESCIGFWADKMPKNRHFLDHSAIQKLDFYSLMYVKADDQGPWVYFPRDKPNNGAKRTSYKHFRIFLWKMKDNKSGRSGVSKMPRMLGQWQNSTQRIILRSKLRFVLLFEVHNLILAKSIKSLIRKKRASYKQRILLAP